MDDQRTGQPRAERQQRHGERQQEEHGEKYRLGMQRNADEQTERDGGAITAVGIRTLAMLETVLLK